MIKKHWGCYKPYKHCIECGFLQQPLPWSFPDENCPFCGSQNIEIVIGRWQYSTSWDGRNTYYEYEVREKRKPQTREG